MKIIAVLLLSSIALSLSGCNTIPREDHAENYQDQILYPHLLDTQSPDFTIIDRKY